MAKPLLQSRLAEQVLMALGRLPWPGRNDRLLVRLNSTEMREAYMLWQHLREGTRLTGWLPRLEAFDFTTLPGAPYTFVLAAEGAANPPILRFTHFGPALTARLGRSPLGEVVQSQTGAHEVFAGMAEAYARCAKTHAPHYDYARYAFDDGGEPVAFERLLLPVSSAGGAVPTHLIGLAMFSGSAS